MFRRLLSNGKGHWMLGCRYCPKKLDCPAGNDVLRALAVAKAAGWSITQHEEEEWRPVCPDCIKRGCQ
jgi:hypothetical protein